MIEPAPRGLRLALLLAAAFGTSAATPIAGAGFSGSAWQEALVTGLLYSGSAAIIAAALLVIYGLRKAATGRATSTASSPKNGQT